MKTKKNKRDRRVLIGAAVIAGVITAGSTFAWFTSKDEVTNRLTASADYGVSIVEDFTPPEDMTPGQTVNKDVSVVNTGSIDALVRVQLENMLKIKKYSGVVITDAEDGVVEYHYSDGTVSSTASTEHGTLDYQVRDFKVSYPIIPDGQTAVTLSPEEYTDSNGNKHANEVSLIQAGGELVVAAGKAVDVNDQAVKSGDDGNQDYSGADQYKPTENGLYIFRRTVYEGADNDEVRYSGYWYQDGTYYALVTDDTATGSTVYLPDGAVTEDPAGTGSVVTDLNSDNIKIKTTTEADATTTAGAMSCELGKFGTAGDETTWTAATETGSTDATHIKVTYAGDTDAATDDVVFFITLADDWSDNWTYLDDETAVANGSAIGHFYYKDDLEAGDTSKELITEVKMADAVTQQAYVDLTYDINVVLESVQITFDADGNEILPGGAQIGGKNSSDADSAKTSGVLNANAQVTTRTSGEIDAIEWT